MEWNPCTKAIYQFQWAEQRQRHRIRKILCDNRTGGSQHVEMKKFGNDKQEVWGWQ